MVGICLLSLSSLFAQQSNLFTPEVYARVKTLYGENASEDVADWRHLIDKLQREDIDEKLYGVNRFFNRFDFVDDLRIGNRKTTGQRR